MVDPETTDHDELLDADAPFEDGFNTMTLVGALFVGFVMLPGAIYMGLVTGQTLGGAAQWVTVILFVEIAKRSFIRLKKQEIIILYGVAGSLVAMGLRLGSQVNLFGGPFGGLIWDQYLVQSPQAEGFGIAHLVPAWKVPPRTSDALLSRSFIHAAWIIPIVLLVVHNIAFRIMGLAAGYTLYRVTNDIERLPYPLAPVYASGATALAETSSKSETWRWRVFSIGAMIGICYGAIYLIVPTITGAVLAKPVEIIPIPFIDLTRKAGTLLPGSIFGIWTDLGFVFAGFVLPFSVVCGMFVGAVLMGLVLNPIFYQLGMLPTWKPGMTVIPTTIAASLDVWISVTIGIACVVGVVGIVGVIKALATRRANQQGQVGPDVSGRGDIPMVLALGIWALFALGYVILCHKLVPLFPLWLLIFFGFVWSPFVSYVRARMVGITGSPQGATFPYIREGLFILSGYRGVDIWFAPVPIFDFGPMAQGFKQLELTRTKFISTVKATCATVVILLVCSFIFWSVIWKLAPIPSSTYPYVQKMWPLFAFNQCLWNSATLGEGKSFLMDALRWERVLGGAGAAFALFGLCTLFKIPVGFFYGMVTGLAYWVHRAIPTMAGGLLSRYYFARKFSEKRWKQYTPVLLAGYSCGMGLIAMAAVATALIAKAVSQIVF